MVELALILPVLFVLITGAAQVGAIIYGQITVQTAAREGARVASQQPNLSQAFVSGLPNPLTKTCLSADTDPVCVSVRNASGLLDGSKFAVTVQPDCTTFTCTTGATTTGCAATWVHDGAVKVTVSFDVPIFVPFVNKLLATPNTSARTVSTTIVSRVTPCTLNLGK